jgi:hypothetical protein
MPMPNPISEPSEAAIRPAYAGGVAAAQAVQGPGRSEESAEALFPRLAEKAERVRWKMEQIPWQSLEPGRAGPELLDMVKDIAFAELTTYTASQRFLKDFWDDADFTQWVSVWFYEETRHPQVLLKWLRRLGVEVDEKFLLKGRGTAPFMKSRMGTLVTNVISEMVASSNYYNLHIHSPEPVLSAIALNISVDEARHASSFYSYAKRMLERSRQPDVDRRDALKVLYMWFQENDRVKHPVNEFHGRRQNGPEAGLLLGKIRKDYGEVKRRACRRIGNLVGLSIATPEDIFRHLRDGERVSG